MKVLVQRVKEASVKVDRNIVGSIGYGYMLLVSFTYGDDEKVIDYMINKIINLRIMDDENKVMNKNSRFKRPSGIVAARVSVGSNPPLLSSSGQVHLFVKGTQPTKRAVVKKAVVKEETTTQ